MSSLITALDPNDNLKPLEISSSGNLKIDLASSSGTGSINVDVTGNTIGLATSANQTTANADLATIVTNTSITSGAVVAGAMQVDISSDSAGLATSALQTSGNTSLSTIAGAVSGTEMQVDVVTSALPSGAATESTLTTISGDTTSIDGKISTGSAATASSLQQVVCYGRDSGGTLDALRTDASGHLEVTVDDFVKGQDVMADSFPVVIASNQSAIPVTSAAANTSNTNETLTPGSGGTGNSTTQDMDGFTNLTIFGNSTNTSDQIQVQTSHNGTTWYLNQEHYVSQQFSSGDFAVNISNTGARYYRITQTDTQTAAFTMNINSSKK